MWRYRYPEELYHYGVKGMKWGVRRGPPYPVKKKSVTNRGNYVKIGFQFFAKKASARKTVRLPKKEYAHVMSELATNITKEQRKNRTIVKYIGQYAYTFENNFDNTYRVIGKEKI